MVTYMQINIARLWASLMNLAKIGAYHDERTGLQGVNRLALTKAEGEGRHLVKRWFEEAGLEVRVDKIGNCYARRRGRRNTDAPVMSGSHIDSVPTAGAFDGCLGVLGALEVIHTLNDHQIETARPIEIAFFTDEEGARFGTDMLGSSVAVGRLPLEQALSLKDRQGKSVAEELEHFGFRGTHPERLDPPHAYVECHIEQGPILRAANQDLGVVTGVQSISWQEATIIGKSSHAGTTPMSLRRDAGLAASKLNLKLHQMAVSGQYGEMRATMGGIQHYPGMTNIIPGRAWCTIDLRNPEDALMAASERDVASYLKQLEQELGVEISTKQTARTPLIRFSEEVQRIIASKMTAHRLVFQKIISGAGHDAQELSSLCPTAMIFVPGEYEGISHNPREYSTPQQCQNGVQILLETILELAS
jgi:beta-ureidopropionase / N-carbamoyl-L-amino-acid hydrolase